MIKATETLVARFRAQVDGDTPIDGAEAVDAVAEFVRAYVAYEKDQASPVFQAVRESAKENNMLSEGTLEVDDNAVVSRAEHNPDCGAYVQAWIWVSDEEAGVCSECGEATVEDGEGFDGKCGNCADKEEAK